MRSHNGLFYSGIISQKDQRDKILYTTLLIYGLLIMCMPFIAQWILRFVHLLSFKEAL